MDWDNLDLFQDSSSCSDRRATISTSDGRSGAGKSFGSNRRGSTLFRQDKRPKCDTEDSIALSESPMMKSKTCSDGFEGFSIVKNRVPSAANSPFVKGDDLFRSLHNRGRSSSNGCRLFPSGVPHSPQEYHTPMSHPVDTEKFLTQISSLQDEIALKNNELHQVKIELEKANAARAEAVEDANSIRFMSSLQEQRISELEQQQSRDRMERNEAISQKSRKHRAVVKKLNQDRAAYEERADQMIQQMNEQMGQLQKMAMSRIESLEKELMSQRHSNDQLQAECTRLHACAAAAMASATKQRQLAAVMKLSSPGSAKKYLFGSAPQSGERRVRERHSSTGSNSTTTSTVMQDDGDGDEVGTETTECVEDHDCEDEDDEDLEKGGTEVDENEFTENLSVSAGSSPCVEKLACSPYANKQPTGVLEEEVWASI